MSRASAKSVNSVRSAPVTRSSSRAKQMSLKAKEVKLAELEEAYDAFISAAIKFHEQSHRKLNQECCQTELLSIKKQLLNHLKPVDDTYIAMRELSKNVNPIMKTEVDRLRSDQRALLEIIAERLAMFAVSDRNHESISGNDSSDNESEKPSIASARHCTPSIKSFASVSHKTGSSYGSLQRVREAQIQADVARKQLEAQLEYDALEKEIQEKQRQLKQQKMKRLAEIEAEKAAALEEALEEEELASNAPRSSRARLFLNSTQKPNDNSRSSQEANSLSKNLIDALTLSRLPAPEPAIFSGDPLMFAEWNTAFTTLIENKAGSDMEKMYYLKRYVSGKAKEAISGYFLLDSSKGYAKARNKLRERFGSEFAICDAFRDKIDAWPKITGKGGEQLLKFSDFLSQCLAAKESITELRFLDDNRENRKMVQKLPDWLINRWARVVTTTKSAKGRYPTFKAFVEFIAAEAMISCEPLTNFKPNILSTTNKPSKPSHGTVLKTTATAFKDQKCLHCNKNNHSTVQCRSLEKKSADDKQAFVRTNKLCFACLEPGHLSKQCSNKSKCSICSRSHPTAMHLNQAPKEKTEKQITVEPANVTSDPPQDMSSKKIESEEATCRRVSKVNSVPAKEFASAMIVPVWVSCKENPGQEVLAYALLDSQSDATFILENLSNKLDAPKTRTKLALTTMTTSATSIDCDKVNDLIVRGLNLETRIKLPAAYTRQHVPMDASHIPTPRKALSWSHLANIADQLPEPLNCEVGLLIGYNCPQALTPREVISGTENEPFAIRTDLGWSIVGKMMDTGTSVTHKIAAEDVGIVELVKDMNKDFIEEPASQKTMSIDDHRFLELMKENIYEDKDNYITMPLPLKERPEANKSYITAMRRYELLKNKFAKDPQYALQYKEFMADIIDRGEAEPVPDEELSKSDSWYIPHFGVFHPKKPEKIRVVYDCAAKSDDKCLNDYLLQGPDLVSSLLGILLRFREQPVALMADIERMFHQFRVTPKDRDYLRFLWEEDGKLSVYRMNVHLFGAKSSPSCATYGLRHAAMQAPMVEHKGKEYILSSFYVDDGLISVKSAADAIEVFQQATTLCKRVNIRLHKFVSNDRMVMKHIPSSERAKETVNLDLSQDPLPKERALGLEWNVDKDAFQFTAGIEAKPLTRRGVLSTISTIYDPIGFLAPFILIGKGILQDICKIKANWDDPLDSIIQPQWKKWLSSLNGIEKIAIPRCLKANEFKDTSEIRKELHHFSDASLSGYGACSYLKTFNENGDVYCTLILAKSKVAPMKTVTVPRLELQAAVLATKLSQTIKREMKFHGDVQEYFWTDSKIVLGYVTNEEKRFHIFVANRVQVIRDRSDPKAWHYVSSGDNPADHASRGCTPEDLIPSNWFSGPKFLYTIHEYPQVSMSLDPNDKEVKATCCQAISLKESMYNRCERFSTLKSVKRALALLLRVVLIKKELSWRKLLDKAILLLLKWCQERFYSEELHMLAQHKQVNTALAKLDPFIDEQGLLRVGGRLGRSLELSYSEKHPVILPNNTHLTKLIIDHYHKLAGHSGKGITMNRIRSEGYWIINCGQEVASFINKCVICKRLRATTSIQKMADLPRERTEPSPPFTYAGCDVFGPFEVKEGRKTLKKYGCIFTCLSSRAVHVEVLDDMSTDAFLSAFRCLVALRGPVTKLFSDQGTNFIGAKSEIHKAFLEMSEANKKLLAPYCEFEFNTPASSHMGGVWERQIRTIRNVLQGLLLQNHTKLDSSGLRTLFYEVTAIVNSRPLTLETINDPKEPTPITPNHLLTQKIGVTPPLPGDFNSTDVYSRKRWRRVQYLADQFWHRWKREYIQSLQPRKKWTEVSKNIKPGTVVTLQDTNQLRNTWSLAIVTSVRTSTDGLVRAVVLRTVNNSGKVIMLERPVTKVKVLIQPEK